MVVLGGGRFLMGEVPLYALFPRRLPPAGSCRSSPPLHSRPHQTLDQGRALVSNQDRAVVSNSLSDRILTCPFYGGRWCASHSTTASVPPLPCPSLGLCYRLGGDMLSDLSANYRLGGDRTGRDNAPQGSLRRGPPHRNRGSFPAAQPNRILSIPSIT